MRQVLVSFNRPASALETDRLGGDIGLAEALAGNGVVIAQTGSNLNPP